MTTLEEQMRMMPDIAYSDSRMHGNDVAMHFFSNPGNQDWGSAIDGARYGSYHQSDISDMVEDGAILDAKTGQAYASSTTNLSGAQKLQEAYEAFCRTYAGSRMIQQIGKPDWDGYAYLDLKKGAMAACLSAKNGHRTLAWDKGAASLMDAGLMTGPDLEQAVLSNLSRYGHAFGNPDSDPTVVRAAAFYEAMRHETGHYHHFNNIFDRPVEVEEFKTYMETAKFYRQLAEETKDSSYAMSKFYEAIADTSEAKASRYGSDADSNHCQDSGDRYTGLEQVVGNSCEGPADAGGAQSSHDSCGDCGGSCGE